MRTFQTDCGTVQVTAERAEAKSEFEPPTGWKLLQRREVDCSMPFGKNETLFHEKWFHPDSQSGIVAYSTFEASRNVCGYEYSHEAAAVYYVVEGYGIGTLDSDFREIGEIAPVERSEHGALEDARQALRVLMEDNEALFRGGEFRNRQAATLQLPKESASHSWR